MSIKFKVTALTAFSCALLLGVMLANIFYQKKVASGQVDQELETLMKNHTTNVVQNVHTQLTGLNEVLVTEVSNGLSVARNVMANVGKISLDKLDTVEWKAINQYTKKPQTIRIPKMMIGGKWLGKNSEMTSPSPIVDQTKRLVGGTATIFQRINENGDMLRVCTNVEKLDKSRAIGTYIPAINPDGSENPVVSTLMSGKTFFGRAYVVNAWYLTSYEPIYDTDMNIIGALYFGIMQEKTDVLRKGINNTVLGKSGYLYVLDREGNYIVSKEDRGSQKNIWSKRDSEGNLYVQTIIKKALQLQFNEVGFHRYSIKDSGAGEMGSKLSAISYFEPWDWIVVADVNESDFKTTKFKMQQSIEKMAMWGAVIGLIFLVVIILLAMLVSDKITKPIINLTEAAEEISQGNLKRKIDITSKDETGKLAEAFERMQSSLQIAAKRARGK